MVSMATTAVRKCAKGLRDSTRTAIYAAHADCWVLPTQVAT